MKKYLLLIKKTRDLSLGFTLYPRSGRDGSEGFTLYPRSGRDGSEGFTLYPRSGRDGSEGFTLIELIVVIAILTTLITTTFVVINPGKQFSKARNAKRIGDINTILGAIGQYASDNKGALPNGITSTPQVISNTGSDLCNDLIPKYISSLPVDPLTDNGNPITNCSLPYSTNYIIVKESLDNRITVSAPAAENSETISVTR